MAAYYGNDAYIKVDSTELKTYFVSINLEQTMEAIDITHGSGVTHRMRGEGLLDASMNLVVTYDAAASATILAALKPGLHEITYGPEGNTAGMPKHVQKFIVTSVGHEVVVEKGKVQLTASLEAADAPTVNMFGGGKF